MKPIKREIREGVIYITVQQNILFSLIKRIKVYSSRRILVGEYRVWREEPDQLLIGDRMSLQLDEWNNGFFSTH